jgi:hypothetical protein
MIVKSNIKLEVFPHTWQSAISLMYVLHVCWKIHMILSPPYILYLLIVTSMSLYMFLKWTKRNESSNMVCIHKISHHWGFLHVFDYYSQKQVKTLITLNTHQGFFSKLLFMPLKVTAPNESFDTLVIYTGILSCDFVHSIEIHSDTKRISNIVYMHRVSLLCEFFHVFKLQ